MKPKTLLHYTYEKFFCVSLLFNVALGNISFTRICTIALKDCKMQYCATLSMYKQDMHVNKKVRFRYTIKTFYIQNISRLFSFERPQRGRRQRDHLPRMQRFGCTNPVARDKSRSNRQLQLHNQILGTRCECQGSSGMTIYKDDPCHSRCGKLKKTNPLLNGHDGRALVKIYSPSPVMKTPAYERNTTKREENQPTNQTNKQTNVPLVTIETNGCKISAQ